MSLKILMIATCPYYFVRGKSLRVHANVTALQSLGHRVTVLTYWNGATVADLSIKRTPRFFRMRNPYKTGPTLAKFLSDLFLFRMAKKELRQDRYDLIVSEDIEGAVIAAKLKRRFGIPVVMDLHGIFTELLENNLKFFPAPFRAYCDKMERTAWRRADFLICNWPHVEKRVKISAPNVPAEVLFDIPPEKVHQTLRRPFPATSAGEEWKKRLEKKRVVFYSGNFAPYQNFSLALRGLKRLFEIESSASDIVLVAAGSGFETYQAQAKELGLSDSVLFLGEKTPEEAVDLCRLAEVCLSLIPVGGNPPSKLISYFLAGRPILACDSGAHRQLLSDGKNAVLCQNDPNDFAEKLRVLLTDASLRVRLEQASRDEAERFTPEVFIGQWETLLKSLRFSAELSS